MTITFLAGYIESWTILSGKAAMQ